jgi:DNA topoisomerase-3
MKLIIAEKKNLAVDIAKAMSKTQQMRDGYIECGGFTVTWCSGHLLEQCAPHDYDPALKSWSLQALPIIPSPFKLKPKEESGPYAGKAKKQLAVIRGLVAKATEIVHAGDPEREGQLIVDEVLEWAGCKAPVVKRLWPNAQTDEGLREAFSRMKPNSEYRNLYNAARCRAEADWVVGLNCTRGWTLLWQQKGHQGVANVGRVKTPTLGLVYERDKIISNFVPKDYYIITAEIAHANGTFRATWQAPKPTEPPAFDESGRLLLAERAKSIVQAVSGAQGQISRATKTRKSEAPPLLLSLSDAQRLGSKLGYSPEETLAALQALYDTHKLTTYPRTDCRHAPLSEHAKAAQILPMLGSVMPDILPWALAEPARKSAAWDDGKLGAHFALLPTGKKPDLSALPKRERDIFLLVARQYAAQFFPNYEYDSTVIEATISGHVFKATGQTPVAQGWKMVFASAPEADDSKKEESNQKLPACAASDPVRCPKASVSTKKTEPPPHYTAETLLDAMENAHRYVQDEAVKRRLKQVEGIGTPATRSGIIQSLVIGGFIEERKSKKAIQYRITERGRALIESIPSTLKRVDFTALLEGKLEAVAQGAMSPDQFLADLRTFMDRLVLRMKDGSALAEIPQATTAHQAAKPAGKATGKTPTAPAGKRAPTQTRRAAKAPSPKRAATPRASKPAAPGNPSQPASSAWIF